MLLLNKLKYKTGRVNSVCTVAVMSSVADMSSDVIGFTEPIISCVLSNNTQHKTGN